MSVNLRYPNITAGTEREQISQIKSYLHQLVEQLNYALPSMGGTTQAIDVQGAEISYYELRTLIIQGQQLLQTEFDKLSLKMTSEYVKKSGWDASKDLVTDADGNVVADSLFGDAGRTLVWESADPDTLQSGELDLAMLAGYDGLEIVYASHGTVVASTGFINIIPDGLSAYEIKLTDHAAYESGFSICTRTCRLNNGKLVIDVCNAVRFDNADGFQYEVNPSACVPWKIYGINTM